MKLAPSCLALLAALAAAPQQGRAGSLDDDAPGWRKPRYDRPVYVPRREREAPPASYGGASLVPPMAYTYDPHKRDFRGHDFVHRGHGFAHRGHGGQVRGPAMIGGARR